MFIGTSALEVTTNIKVSTSNVQLYFILLRNCYRKCKYQYIFEKYIPLHRLQRNNADKHHGPI